MDRYPGCVHTYIGKDSIALILFCKIRLKFWFEISVRGTDTIFYFTPYISAFSTEGFLGDLYSTARRPRGLFFGI